MAGPWEKYKAAPAAAAGPWSNYAAAMPADVPQLDASGSVVRDAPVAAVENNDSLLQRIAGVGETALTAATGAAGSVIGAAAGVGKSLIGGKYGTQAGVREGEAMAGQVAQALTYQPRTQTGQAGIQMLAQAAAPLEGLAGVGAADAILAGRAVSAGSRSLRDLAAGVNAPINAADAVRSASPGTLGDLVRAPRQLSGAGAARASEASLRAERAAALPAPIKLTRGQLTRDRQQVAFERETAKQAEGAPLSARYEDQNAAFMQNLDAAVDEAGAQNVSRRAVGKAFVSALDVKDKAKRAEINTLYKQAREAGEMEQAVDVTALTDWIAKNKGKDKLAPIITTIENELKQNAKLEGGGVDNLTLAQRPSRTTMTLGASEDLRQAINKLAEPGTPNVVFGKDAKALIDAAQEGKGGDLFRQARRAYENHANEFTNRDVIDRMLRTKPGTKDRAVSFEDAFDKTIMNGSTDDVRHVFRVLEAHPKGTAPEVVAAGQQAAKDMRGAVINHIKEEMTKNLNVDSRGARTGSTAKIDSIVRELDADGKLEVIFGKKGAQQVRDLRDVAIDIYTSPSGTVNSSNTASALMRKLDDVAGYAKSVPIVGKAAKYMTDQIQSANTSRKVRKALDPKLKDLAGKERR